MWRALLLVVAMMGVGPAGAAEITVPAGRGALASAIAGAAPGDVLILEPGRHRGPVRLTQPVTLDGRGQAEIDGGGHGSVISIAGPDIVVRSLHVLGSGSDAGANDAGIRVLETATGALIEGNRLTGNLIGVNLHGAQGTVVRDNIIEGRRDPRMNERGNGIYIWNAPGSLIEGNDIRWGRDGIFSNVSRDSIYRGNLMRDLRFAVHYMYTNDSEVSGNISVGNHLGFALMFSNRIDVQGNISLNDRDQGLMLNYANSADVSGNLVRGAGKCLFLYNSHRGLIHDNRFEGCDIGIHFTAGSERNAVTGNAFIGNRNQVKYVGTTHVEWSHAGRGNYWSDHAAFDLNADGVADSRFRPNDLMDHILWSQPAAALLAGSPAVQLLRWTQSNFPAALPGGVLDSHPLMRPVTIDVPAPIAEMAAKSPVWRERSADEEPSDPHAGH